MKKNKLLSLILVAAMVMSMIVLPVSAADATCPNHADAVWTEVTAADWAAGKALTTGHYKLVESITIAHTTDVRKYLTIAAGETVCIDLNGCNITQTKAVVTAKSGQLHDYQIFRNEGTLSIMDSTAKEGDGVYTSGVISGGFVTAGAGTAYARGGNYSGAAGSVLNLYSGTFSGGLSRKHGIGDTTATGGGNIYSEGAVNIYGGMVKDGKAYTNYANDSTSKDRSGTVIGGNIAINGGTFTMTGGTITNGKADNAMIWYNTQGSFNAYGGNLSLVGKATATISGGVISNGSAVNTAKGATSVVVKDGVTTITDTLTAAACGGNIFVAGAATLTLKGDAKVIGGTASATPTPYTATTALGKCVANAMGGNIYLVNSKTKVTISENAVVEGGQVTAIATAGEGGTVSQSAYGGSIYLNKTTALTINGGVIGGLEEGKGGHARSGGNVFVNTDATMTMSAGLIAGGYAEAYGGNIYVLGGTISTTGGTITGGSCVERGGNIYIDEADTSSLKNTVLSNGEGTSSASRGGNIYSYKTNLTLENCTISGGIAKGRGGNLSFSGTKPIIIDGGTITAGTVASSYGNNIYCTDGAAGCHVTLQGGVVVQDGKAELGGNIASMYGKLTVLDATIKNGKATEEGDNILITGTTKASTIVISAGAQIESGSVYVANVDKTSTVINTLSIETGAVIDTLEVAKSGNTVTIEDGVTLASDPTAYMTGEAYGLSDGKYTTYGTLASALAVAGADDVTVLVKDVDAQDGDLVVTGTLDLNGKTITNAYVVNAAFSDAKIADSVGTGSVSATQGVKVFADNGQVAVATEAGGAVHFETVSIPQRIEVIESEGKITASVKFFVDKLAENTLLDEALKNNPESVKLRITVTWKGEDDTTKTHSYVYKPDMIEKYQNVWNTGMLTCQISGLEQLKDFTITADVFAGGAVVNGKAA